MLLLLPSHGDWRPGPINGCLDLGTSPEVLRPIDQRIQSRKISKLITRGTKGMTPLSVAGGAPNGPEASNDLDDP